MSESQHKTAQAANSLLCGLPLCKGPTGKLARSCNIITFIMKKKRPRTEVCIEVSSSKRARGKRDQVIQQVHSLTQLRRGIASNVHHHVIGPNRLRSPSQAKKNVVQTPGSLAELEVRRSVKVSLSHLRMTKQSLIQRSPALGEMGGVALRIGTAWQCAAALALSHERQSRPSPPQSALPLSPPEATVGH